MRTATLTQETVKERQPGFLACLSEEDQQLYFQIPDKVDFVPNDFFSSPSAEDKLFGDDAEHVEIPSWRLLPVIEPEESQLSYGIKKILNQKQEALLFLRYNYARYRLSKLLEAQQRPTAKRAREMILWYERTKHIQAGIAQANLGLVTAMAKRARITNVEFGELISEGNMALLKSVDKFDISRGFKFSTYACRAILRALGCLAAKAGRYRRRFPIEFDPDLERSDYEEVKSRAQRQDSINDLRRTLASNGANLDALEQAILERRFPILPDVRKQTLEGVARSVGLSKERIRQIQNRALDKLRVVLSPELKVV